MAWSRQNSVVEHETLVARMNREPQRQSVAEPRPGGRSRRALESMRPEDCRRARRGCYEGVAPDAPARSRRQVERRWRSARLARELSQTSTDRTTGSTQHNSSRCTNCTESLNDRRRQGQCHCGGWYLRHHGRYRRCLDRDVRSARRRGLPRRCVRIGRWSPLEAKSRGGRHCSKASTRPRAPAWAMPAGAGQ
jgi:hypothetical protein